ncbi:DNA-binding winged helix-turn-helix (wHTH) protein [Sphingomonas leidyi]|uniref:DNA-binding winged helix-turn-helix (WHTH) protein n=1 Tax=Sphingomonas leidyi TaxID=68569 RepID=A0A7X5ZUM5_9SPHN|nr:winged helix-turn-helix domain-containing protein [Sphingomonas leidyi]NIJ64226.1 DNA-binding winged helix-turn-helix (wHTH) protein [Sphingomonas leidyi]
MYYQPMLVRPVVSIAPFSLPIPAGDPGGKTIAFGEFLAIPAARSLTRRGEPIDIGGRAFDLLIALLRRRGTIVTKQEIMRQVWPSTVVDEGNLRFQMAALRKLLGNDRDMIKTVSGRGYVLIDDRRLLG